MGSNASVSHRDYHIVDSMSTAIAGREYDWDYEPEEPSRGVVVVDGICRMCRHITSHALRNGFSHYETGADLQDSKDQGCRLCMLLWTAYAEGQHRLGRLTLGELESRWTIELTEMSQSYGQIQVHLTCGPTGDEIRTHLKLQALPRGSYYGHVDETLTFPTQSESNLNELQGLHTFDNMTNPESFRKARLMMEHCEKEHPKCRHRASNQYRLPSRVIDVGSANKRPFLKITQNESGKWVTLSYCWGGPQTLTLTRETYHTLREGINMSMLPKTLSDAILATRQLGIQYLWIDALCILQDSVEDWNAESTDMHRIYGESWATIAAKDAVNSQVGLFLPAKHLAPPCRFLYQTREFLTVEAVLSLEEEESLVPLFSRGWTLQERLLSPRVILWSSSSYSMECQSVEDQSDVHGLEDFRKRRLPQILMEISPSVLQRYISWQDEVWRAKPGRDTIVEPVTLYQCWLTILQDFWNRDLTYLSDRLPALAGIAQRFQRLTGDDYLSGLWRSQLQICLSWYLEQGNGPERPNYRKIEGPSWSWTSAPIGCRPHHLCNSESLRLGREVFETAELELLQSDVKLKGSNAFGEVSRGSLLLRCHSITGTVDVRDAYLYISNGHRFTVMLDDPNFDRDPDLGNDIGPVESKDPVEYRYSW